jgi:hypothetical protein
LTDRASTTAGASCAGAAFDDGGSGGGVATDDPPWSSQQRSATRRFSLHGQVIEIECDDPVIQDQLDAMLALFAGAKQPPHGAQTPVSGSILRYDVEEVLRSVSPTAGQVASQSGAMDLTEVYEEGERYWFVDERWGLAEVNPLKGQWRSWGLPGPALKLDPPRCAERAVLWPLAQLMPARGVHLLPAVAAVRDGWAVLILCPFTLEPELRAMIRAGYRIVGQRWTAVRQEEGRLALLHMPGRVERPGACHSRGAADDAWLDLTAGQGWARQEHAFCDAVLVVEPGRRGCAEARELSPPEAAAHLRRAWPLPDVHAARRACHLPALLSRQCRCASAQLSRDPRENLELLAAMRESPVRLDWADTWGDAAGTSAAGVRRGAPRGRAA